MKLIELIQAVKEKNLTKEQIEAYSDQLSHLFAQTQLEMADLEKEEAIFMEGWIGNDGQASVAQKKVAWKATASGQRLITLKRYAVATKEIINSCKSRVYRLIY